MQLLGYEIRKVPDQRAAILDGAEYNAKGGLITAQLELTHHELLLEQAPLLERTEAEVKGYRDAIERDKKSINNWETQLRAIHYEREKETSKQDEGGDSKRCTGPEFNAV